MAKITRAEEAQLKSLSDEYRTYFYNFEHKKDEIGGALDAGWVVNEKDADFIRHHLERVPELNRVCQQLIRAYEENSRVMPGVKDKTLINYLTWATLFMHRVLERYDAAMPQC